jgi:hypothetical protein
MPRSNTEEKIAELAAVVVYLCSTLERFFAAAGIDLPGVAEQLSAAQDIAYGAVATRRQDQFGKTFAVINGILPTTPAAPESDVVTNVPA